MLLIKTLIYPAGSTSACHYAADILKQCGFPLTDHPTPEITHLLLDVPSFQPDGRLRGGEDPAALLSMLPQTLTVVGGNLDHPALTSFRVMDLLKDAYYLAQNAAITADCAVRVAAPLLKTTFSDSPALIIGWGRIGKCLAQLLRSMGCPVTIAARKETDRAAIRSLGYQDTDINSLSKALHQFRLLYNTAPELVLSENELSLCSNCVKVELASKNGLEGSGVVTARGLPGIHTPESSGKLIAETFIRLAKEEHP